MPRYLLARNGEPIDTFGFGTGSASDLSRDEFDSLKRLDGCGGFSFGITPRDALPPADRDPLDVIALEIVNSTSPRGQFSTNYQQAKDRVTARGLQ